MKKFKEIRERKYGDAMSSRLPSHLEDPRVEPKKVVKKPVKRNPKNHSWKLFREEAALDAALDGMFIQITENITGHGSVENVAKQHGYGRREPTKGGDYRWYHPAGHVVDELVDPSGKWSHQSAGQRHWTHGIGGEELHKHLTKIHGIMKEEMEHLTPRERMSGGERLKDKPEPKKNQYAVDLGAGKKENKPKMPIKHVSVKEGYEVAYDESGDSGYKVGDEVVPKIGPHKGVVHTVIHVHPTGHLNIKPHVRPESNRYRQGAVRANPNDVTRHMAEGRWDTFLAAEKQARETARIKKLRKLNQKNVTPATHEYESGVVRKWGLKMEGAFLQTGINRQTVQEVFQAAKDKKRTQTDSLPTEGANEPNQEVPNQGTLTTQDGGAPGPQKKSNAPKPENSGKSKKLVAKGPGVDDKFQPAPFVTPLTTMPDTSSPKSGSQGVR
jgi:hypothetical protein